MTDPSTMSPVDAPLDVPDPWGVRLLGGEMLLWSDDDDPGVVSVAPAAAGALLGELAARVVQPGDRILVAGPHPRGLPDLLAGRDARVTFVLRSLPDARALARANADRTTTRVCCGGIEKLPGDERYDVVVALGGLERLLSSDSPDLAWTEIARRLAGALTPGGVLLLGVENEIGVHRLCDVAAPDTRRGDGNWRPPLGPGRPTDPAGLCHVLDGLGMAPDRCYAAYAGPAAPSLLIDHELLEEGLLAEATEPLLAAACADGFGGRPVLSDPRWILRAALARGLAGALAPGWVAVARPYGDPSPETLPWALAADGAAPWTVVRELHAEGPAWELCGTAAPRVAGRIIRDPARLRGPVRGGRDAETLLRAACDRHDLPAVRDLLGAYAEWLFKQAENGLVPGRLAFATLDNLAAVPSGFAALDPSWEWAEPLPAEHVLARTLRRFLARMLQSGQRHPWPASMSPDDICTTLHAMAGRPAGRPLLDAGLLLEAEVAASMTGRPVADLVQRLRHAAEAPGAVRGHRELVSAHARLQDEVRLLRQRADWADEALTARELEVKELKGRLREQRAEMRSGRHGRSGPGRLVVAPLRYARRVLVHPQKGQT
ncbi:class I SAM-dependent methyltransferase [Spirillospora albida]|uniref:class I SAM-dependent methyltransferase n=1 Tax=Spirillospora albida TaxID=58123 RepID=UPI000689557B|nr:class I SAM-dependent methyltransferase [Spirillospora albida]